jgi:hypothetical protein
LISKIHRILTPNLQKAASKMVTAACGSFRNLSTCKFSISSYISSPFESPKFSAVAGSSHLISGTEA